jgi:hypothetical protein
MSPPSPTHRTPAATHRLLETSGSTPGSVNGLQHRSALQGQERQNERRRMCQLSTIKLTSGAWTRTAPPGLPHLEGCLEGSRPCSFRYISRRCCANLRLATRCIVLLTRGRYRSLMRLVVALTDDCHQDEATCSSKSKPTASARSLCVMIRTCCRGCSTRTSASRPLEATVGWYHRDDCLRCQYSAR